MRRREFLKTSTASLGAAVAQTRGAGAGQSGAAPKRKILIAGGGFNTAFVRYMATLTGKTRPRICYLPTANADAPSGSIAWFRSCAPLDVHPFVQESFIASAQQAQSWEEVLLSMDAIVASGGNTLNQQVIWKA